MWMTVLIAIVLGYYYYQLNKRVVGLEETRGPGFSQSFRVNAFEAVVSHKKFGELTGIKSAIKGKEFKDWTKEDKEKWRKSFVNNVSSNTDVKLNYLASEDAYFVSNYKATPYIKTRGDLTNILFNQIVLGDKDGLDSRLEFSIYEKLVKDSAGQYQWMLIPGLEYHDGLMKSDFTQLCEFPLFKPDLTDVQIKRLGFAIERLGGDDVYENSFGEMDSVPLMIDYKKNGVKISFHY